MKRIGFKVSLNDKIVSTFGLDTEGSVSQILYLRNDEEQQSVSINLDCGAFRGDTQEHYKWMQEELNPGDTIKVEIVENPVFDSPEKVYPHDNPEMNEFVLKSKLKIYYRLKEELKDYIKS